MIVSKYISIDTIMSRIHRDLGMQVDKADVYEWTADVMEYLDIPVMFQENVAFLEVKDYKTVMPDGLRAIIQIAKSNSLAVSAEECAVDVVEDIEEHEPDIEIKVCDPCEGNTFPPDSNRSGPSYGRWLNLQFNYDALCGAFKRRRDWEPVRLASQTFYESLVCTLGDGLYNESQYEYSIRGESLLFNFKEGVVALAYVSYRMDENGELMIPDDAHFINAVVARVRYMLSQRLYDRNPTRENEARLDRSDRDYQFRIRQAATKGLRPSSLDEMENRAAAKDYILPRQFRYYDFFKGLNKREQRNYSYKSWSSWR